MKPERVRPDDSGIATIVMGALKRTAEEFNTIIHDKRQDTDSHKCVFLINTHWGYAVTSINVPGRDIEDITFYEQLLAKRFPGDVASGYSHEEGPREMLLQPCPNDKFESTVEHWTNKYNRPYIPIMEGK